MIGRFFCQAVVFAFFLCAAGFAQETNSVSVVESSQSTIQDSQSTAEIGEIVVSATKFGEEAWKSGSSISVVPEGTLRLERPLQTIEPLRGEPGVTVNNGTGALGGVSQVSIRGLPFSRTLVEVDGLRLNRPIDGIANFADLPPLLMGNIELLRGPQSSLYGSEAEGGVISFTTPRGQGEPTGGASFEAGNFGTRRERIFSSGKEEYFDWNVEGARVDSDNERNNNNFRQDAGAMHLGFDVSETSRLDVVGRWTDFTVGSPNGISGFGANDPDDRLIRGMQLISPSFTLAAFEEWESKLTLGYIGVGQRFETPPDAFVNHSESWQIDWQNTFHPVEWNTLVAGVQERCERATTSESSGIAAFDRNTDSAYVSDSVRLAEWWGMTLSARFDDNEQFHDAWTYRASQVFKCPETETRLHMSFGTAFRAPTISELQPLFGPFSGENPNLVPETTEGYDVGVTQPLLGGDLEFDSTYFYNNIVNLIAADSAFVFQNISEARSEGVENSIKWKASKELQVRASATLTATTSKDARFSGNDLARIPRETASVSVTWLPVGGVESSLVWNFNGEAFDNAANTQKLSAFNRLDLYASYQAALWVKIFARCENMLGYRDQQTAFFPGLGRTYAGGVEFKY